MWPNQFLVPGLLLGAYSVLVPVILHFSRRRKGPGISVPSLFFFKPVVRSQRSHRLRRWLVLMLRCAVLGLLAAAFARPFRAVARERGTATVVVFDQSFSLQAGTRWHALRKWLKDQLGSAVMGDALGVIETGTQPHWIAPVMNDVSRAVPVVEAIVPGWGAGRIEPALRRAADALAVRSESRKRLLVVTDHQRLTWSGTDFARKLPQGVELFAPEVARPVAEQVALSNPSLIESGASQTIASVTVTVFSHRSNPRTLRVFAENETRPFVEESLALAQGEVRALHYPLPPGKKPRWVRFALDPDDLPADDAAYVVSGRDDAEQALSTVWLDEAPLGSIDVVEEALKAAGDVAPKFRIEKTPIGDRETASAAILRNAASFAPARADRLEEFLQRGGQALVLLNEKIAAAAWWKTHAMVFTPLPSRSDPWRIHDWSLDDPLVSPFAGYGLRALLGWEFQRGWSLPANVVEPIAWWSDDSPAIAELRVGAGRLIVCGFGTAREEGDWTADANFVPFIHHAATEFVKSKGREHGADSLHPGDVIVLPEGKGSWKCVAGPLANSAARDVEGSVVADTPGIYTYSRGARTRFWAVNVSPEESDLAPWLEGRPWEGLDVASSASKASAEGTPFVERVEAEQQSSLWWWYVVIVGLALLLELPLSNRTAR